jgi:alpha-amylase/alpha-mannosidase (GH57 family)
MTAARGRLKVILCWHMHQPDYRDPVTREFRQPWTCLHALKDYAGMAEHLEAHPPARAVVNFAPTLLEQIEDYAVRIQSHLAAGTAMGDPLLDALAAPAVPQEPALRRRLVQWCLRAHQERVINRFEPYQHLADMARHCGGDSFHLSYLSDAFLTDLVTWYHLAWLAEGTRASDPRASVLVAQGRGYSHAQRRELLALLLGEIENVIPRYRALADAGRIELSVTPYAHPILPLLLDFASAREALPEAPLPQAASYPGGEVRARWHIEQGMAVFERCFGRPPRGCWPGEGSVSDATLRLLGEYGFAWTASGETVLHNSLREQGEPLHALCRPWRPALGGPVCFFRHDSLSDRIGFQYAQWHGDDAAANLAHELTQIAHGLEHPERHAVAIIMDGENAWEYFPENARFFLAAMYRTLAASPALELTTFSSALADGVRPGVLERCVAGSWVYGTFSTWIGEADKNRGWDLLVQAKQAFDAAVQAGLSGASLTEAQRQLAVCEGSDWFWWLGDYNPEEAVRDFEALYRAQLRRLYEMLGQPAPAALDKVLSRGKGSPATGGVMRPGA